ncbi:MAG TPA: acetylornithine transaminase [Clostridia bacterium]|nr:acetylornithine transaminase [Clostridia bacterium]
MKTPEIMQLADKYIMKTYGQIPMAIVKGEGIRVWDADGKEYLDFVAGIAVNSLGHCHPSLVSAVKNQVEKLIHCSNLYYIGGQAKMAEILVGNSCLDKVFFCNSGAEANEAAIKLARKYGKKHGGPEKYEIITALNSFHGRTLATITATGQPKYQKGLEPLPEGFKYVPFDDFKALEEAVGPHTCAILLEPVQGEGGVHPASPEYLENVRELCTEKGLLLIYDEVQCGLGRTGKLFAYKHYNAEPDVMCLAKALAGGLPMGAMLARKEVAEAFQPGDHASTFGGNPLAAAAGVATLNVLLDQGLVENAAGMGEYFKEKLTSLKDKHDIIKEVRGLGLMLGMQLTVPGAPIVEKCREMGLLINCIGADTLRFVPPLIVTEDDVDEAVDILDRALVTIE